MPDNYDGKYPPTRRKSPLLTAQSPKGDFLRITKVLGALDSSISVDTRGANSVAFHLGFGLGLGSEIVFEASVKGGTWFRIACLNADVTSGLGFRFTELTEAELPFNG